MTMKHGKNVQSVVTFKDVINADYAEFDDDAAYFHSGDPAETMRINDMYARYEALIRDKVNMEIRSRMLERSIKKVVGEDEYRKIIRAMIYMNPAEKQMIKEDCTPQWMLDDED